MKFGNISLKNAEGTILAHSLHLEGRVLRKGRTLTNVDISDLRAADIKTVAAARLEDGDLDENEAALKIAQALKNNGLTATSGNTGRANLRTKAAGITIIDAETVHLLNSVNEAITLSTLRPFEPVAKGAVVATVKIITFGIPGNTVKECLSIIRERQQPVRLARYGSPKIGFIQTLLPGFKRSLVEKASQSMTSRLSTMGLEITSEMHCVHGETEIAECLSSLATSGCDIALILGASAIVDRRDIVPSAVLASGGEIEHFGLPVDPGNLLLFARINKMKVLGVPGSARSPRLHGFDWVLQRLVAGVKVTRNDLIRMGVGGMLKEMPGRPLSREQEMLLEADDSSNSIIGGVLLAAGQSRRMGRKNKMLIDVDGDPMVVRAARALIESNAAPVVVVLGHQPQRVKDSLKDLNVQFVYNSNYAEGLSSSLKAGVEALPDDCDGAVVALGDMPEVKSADIDSLIAEFDPARCQSIVVPTHNGKRGNPVVWARRYFKEISAVSGDVGARHLIGSNSDQLHEVSTENSGVLIDLDTPEAVKAHKTEK